MINICFTSLYYGVCRLSWSVFFCNVRYYISDSNLYRYIVPACVMTKVSINKIVVPLMVHERWLLILLTKVGCLCEWVFIIIAMK